MTTLKPRPDPAQTLAALAWAAVTDVGMMTGGIALFAAAPTSTFILAVYAARAGHRSGKVAVVVSGPLLLALLVFSAWQSGGWVNVAVTAVAVVLGFVWVRSRGKPPPGPDSEPPGRSDGSAAGHHPQPD